MNPASKSGPQLGSRTSSIYSLQGYNQLSLQSFRCSLVLINIITYGHTYVFVALFFPLQRTSTYLLSLMRLVYYVFNETLFVICVANRARRRPGNTGDVFEH
jgi:hypothetical protein